MRGNADQGPDQIRRGPAAKRPYAKPAIVEQLVFQRQSRVVAEEVSARVP